MKKVHILNRPTSVSDVTMQFDDIDDDMWQQKAERVRIRRYREFKNHLS